MVEKSSRNGDSTENKCKRNGSVDVQRLSKSIYYNRTEQSRKLSTYSKTVGLFCNKIQDMSGDFAGGSSKQHDLNIK